MRIEKHGDHRVIHGGPVPRGSDGITFRRTVVVREGRDTPLLMAHERVHLKQFRRYGVAGFLIRYLAPYLRDRLAGYGHDAAYRRIPFEVEANWKSRQALLAANGMPAHRTEANSEESNHG